MEDETIQGAACPTCTGPLAWNEAYRQWYCQNCRMYIPPGVGNRSEVDKFVDEIDRIFDSRPPPVYYCQTCSAPLSWVAQYSRWYCYNCKNYL